MPIGHPSGPNSFFGISGAGAVMFRNALLLQISFRLFQRRSESFCSLSSLIVRVPVLEKCSKETLMIAGMKGTIEHDDASVIISNKTDQMCDDVFEICYEKLRIDSV